MQEIPLQPSPNQTFQVQLNNQACVIYLVQQAFGLYCTLYVDTELIIAGVLCENRNRIVRSLYLGFSGDLIFNDREGTDDPVYTGFGTRFEMLYLTDAEVALYAENA